MNFDTFPDVSFIDNDTLESTKLEMINDYKDKYFELTGEEPKLGISDPYRMILYACAVQCYQNKLYIDNAGKMNFIKYAHDNYLDVLGANVGVIRSRGKAATVTLQFFLEEEMNSSITINEGTRVTAGDDVYFAVTETVEITAGNLTVNVQAKCTDIGTIGNGYQISKINTMVDSIPYVSVTNTTESANGEDIETDDSLAERIYLAPSSSSCGTEDSYISNCKESNTNITDVAVSTDTDSTVNVVFMSDGNIPTQQEICALENALYSKDIHPITDKIVVTAPTQVNYAINLTYYINASDSVLASSIQAEVTNAINTYINWQNEKIGRDINPSYLNMLILSAGAKRCEITSPVYTQLSGKQIANLTSQTVTYGGIEND